MEDVVNSDAPGTGEGGSTPEGGAAPGTPPPPPASATSSGARTGPAAAPPESTPEPDPGAAPPPEVLEPRPSPEVRPLVHKHFVAPAMIPLDRVDDDDTFRLRGEVGDVSALATDVARLGQLFPIDVRLKPPDRFQVITGFRRVAALRLLHREKVLARLHTDLSDSDALLMALAAAIHGKGVGREALAEAQERLSAEGRLTPAARDMLVKALEDEGLAPEEVEEEVDADELAADVTLRLGQANQDLSLLADVFEELDDARREELLTQLRYSSELVAYLEGKGGGKGSR
ncbi:MAG: ParB N-terminal domain-containing protein [Myxococcota bacterium]|jgi:ParB-like chromosome segregation protein Spo0J